jgi:DNA gyrase/topoisomerase IV subunit A
MKIIESSISNEIDSGFKAYSMYTVENRAIPSAIDGVKPAARKLIYSMLTEHSNKKVKVAELGGGLAKYNYHHGEESAMGAVVTLTADWNNNCPIFTGHGNFGSRLVQEAAGSRYIFCTLSPEFKKYFIDTEVTSKSPDPENPEPAYYLPTIPWVLVNGTQGIAVGFACNILPRSIKDLTVAVKKYLKDPKKFLKAQEAIAPTFPHFRGTVTQDTENTATWYTEGIVEYVGKFTYKISELPVGYDRAKYVEFLNDLLDAEKIKDYEDNCSEEGFCFDVKVTAIARDKIDTDPIKFFKLRKSHTENITTLGTDGKLKLFDSAADLLAYFCDHRLEKFEEKIAYEKFELLAQISLMTDKAKFIKMVVDRKIDFRQLNKEQLLEVIRTKVTIAEHGKSFINIPLYSCTTDAVESLEEKIRQCTIEHTVLTKTNPMERYLSVL